MGAGEFTISVPLNQALFGFGDAACVPVIEWIARNYLNPVWGSASPGASWQAAKLPVDTGGLLLKRRSLARKAAGVCLRGAPACRLSRRKPRKRAVSPRAVFAPARGAKFSGPGGARPFHDPPHRLPSKHSLKLYVDHLS